MGLAEIIANAFAEREMPAKVTDSDCTPPIDSDVVDTLWFSGKNWREITWNDWKGHDVALSFFTQDALAYWLPSVLLLSLQRPGEYLSSAAYLIRTFGSRNWAPSPDHWKDYFRVRFVGLRTEEYEAIKEWLLFMSSLETYRKYLNVKPGPGDIFERAIETVCLAERESQRASDPDLIRCETHEKGPIMSAANKEVILAFIEDVLNKGRFERMTDLVKEDFIELDPLPGQQQGREGLKAVLTQFRSAFPDIHWAVAEQIADGDKVVTRFTWTGTHRDTFLGIPATGKHVEVKGVVIDRLESGKMADSRILMDTLGMMQQLGVIPAPPSS